MLCLLAAKALLFVYWDRLGVSGLVTKWSLDCIYGIGCRSSQGSTRASQAKVGADRLGCQVEGLAFSEVAS